MIEGSREIKVGLFVFIAFVLLSIVVFSISDFYTIQPRYTYGLKVNFSYTDGIQEGAPVRVSGVQVGEVQAVKLKRDDVTQKTYAQLDVRLSREAQVEENSTATVNTLGFIGEKYLEIIPSSDGSALLKDGAVLYGNDPIPAQKLLASGYDAVRQIEQAVASVNEILGDPKTRNDMKSTFANSKEATAEMAEFLEQANVVMAKIRAGEGTVGKLLMDEGLYNQVEGTVADIKKHPWKLFFRPKEKRKKK